MTDSELKLFLELLPAFGEHFAQNKNSLLAKIYGVFTVKTAGKREINLMLMENAMRLENKKQLKYVFDLKGSTVDRKVTSEIKNTTILKDVNYQITAGSVKNFITLSDVQKRRLRAALNKDVKFLKELGLMDYSILLGIEKIPVSERRPVSILRPKSIQLKDDSFTKMAPSISKPL